ncbi:FtsX-like permease family protein [Gordonia jinhuaensis]|uniref:ABC transporter permease n=2 Tax=Gordonia jinhuaensis TaxID=1517702 RepID=A0A916WT57_9ACTN|nr:ABC transporter permease [Gordonia jinhuaensis]GGB28096.1 ABC transporter permease [Gordonia jinhuaensis]
MASAATGRAAMFKVSLRNLAAHKLRLALTVLSVLLGTSFVAGSMVFTGTISNAFSSIFDNVALGTAVQISPEKGQSAGVPDSVLDEVTARRSELGADRIVADYRGTVTLAKANGKALSTGGAPSIGSAFLPPDQRLSDTDSALKPGGRAPTGDTEIALNAAAADKAGLHVGSRTKVVTGAGSSMPIPVTVVGILDVPGDTGGFVNVQFDQSFAKDMFTDGSHSSYIAMSAVRGVSDDQLKQRVEQLVGNGYKVQTGDEIRQEEKDRINQFLSVFNYILLAFAAIGLVVGTFIIYNTFSMIVAQRVRELALLRAIGASRGQVTRSVLFEAFVVGLLGGVLGLGIGIGIAAILRAVTSGSGLPHASLAISATAVIATILVGVIVTMLSAWAPARRASSISPVEAMRESMTDGASSLRGRTIVGTVLGIIGIALIVIGAFGEGTGPAITVGAGAVAVIVAVVLVAPALSRPIVGAMGTVLGKPFGKLGLLARTNAVRNPRRTAATAFALTLGLMLVAMIGTIGTSFKHTVDTTVDAGIKADLILSSSNQGTVPASVRPTVSRVDGVSQAVGFGGISATVDGASVVGTSPSGPIGSVLSVDKVGGGKFGPQEQVPADGLWVSKSKSGDRGWAVGDTVTFTGPSGTTVPVRVEGVYDNNQLLGNWLMGSGAYERLMPEVLRSDQVILVKIAPGQSLSVVKKRLEDATGDFLTVSVQDRAEFKGQVSSQIDQMLSVLYAMLGLALVIAVLGIVNTLALSVIERTREIGMLRAIGMSRAQVRRMIYLESVLIAIFGAVLGVLMGCCFGAALVSTLKKWGIGDPVLPWSLIITTLIGAAVVGVLAALWPASRAAHIRPLEAIAE